METSTASLLVAALPLYLVELSIVAVFFFLVVKSYDASYSHHICVPPAPPAPPSCCSSFAYSSGCHSSNDNWGICVLRMSYRSLRGKSAYWRNILWRSHDIAKMLYCLLVIYSVRSRIWSRGMNKLLFVVKIDIKQCYCGSVLNNGSVSTAEADCNFECPGNKSQNCGAGNRLNLYIKATTATTPVSTGTPSTVPFSTGGYYAESINGRAITDRAYYDESMTARKCANACTGDK